MGARGDGTVSTPAVRQRPDYLLLLAVAALVILGLDMVYSASYVLAHNSPTYGSDTYFLVRQALWAAIGMVLLLALQVVDYHLWQRLTVPLMGLTLALLAAVLVSHLGHAAYGAQRWLRLGPLPPVEPGEFGKLSLILYCADWLGRRRDRLGSFRATTLPFTLIVAVVCGLIVLQPDLGSAFVVAATAGAMFFIAGADLRHLLLVLGGGAAALVVLVLNAPYRFERVLAYMDPTKDPLGIGWNTLQAEIALGSGGLLGRGLGASRQKFYYLPNAHTDAIFAVIGEELGLIGAAAVILLFALIGLRGFRIALRAPDPFGALLAAGITAGLVSQALINIAVVTAVVPFTGIPLPLVSFGGSSLITSLMGIGLLLSVSRRASPPEPAVRAGQEAP